MAHLTTPVWRKYMEYLKRVTTGYSMHKEGSALYVNEIQGDLFLSTDITFVWIIVTTLDELEDSSVDTVILRSLDGSEITLLSPDV